MEDVTTPLVEHLAGLVDGDLHDAAVALIQYRYRKTRPELWELAHYLERYEDHIEGWDRRGLVEVNAAVDRINGSVELAHGDEALEWAA